MMEKLFNFVSKRPKQILVAAALLTIFFIIVMMGTRVQTNIHDYIDKKYIYFQNQKSD